jgi:hypothetical protein
MVLRNGVKKKKKPMSKKISRDHLIRNQLSSGRENPFFLNQLFEDHAVKSLFLRVKRKVLIKN